MDQGVEGPSEVRASLPGAAGDSPGSFGARLSPDRCTDVQADRARVRRTIYGILARGLQEPGAGRGSRRHLWMSRQ